MLISSIAVVQAHQLDCQAPVTLQNTEDAISSYVTIETGCGSHSTPWVISGISGQIIKLRIIDFGSELIKMNNNSEELPIYGYIYDGEQRTIFYGSTERERLLYQSKSNRISIEILLENDDFGFILQYKSTHILYGIYTPRNALHTHKHGEKHAHTRTCTQTA